ncbi:hypothetical protein M0804_013506 [Polistes exclamans]|nr:hypothetical protein M0804_013506 [Polistes exclamans]
MAFSAARILAVIPDYLTSSGFKSASRNFGEGGRRNVCKLIRPHPNGRHLRKTLGKGLLSSSPTNDFRRRIGLSPEFLKKCYLPEVMKRLLSYFKAYTYCYVPEGDCTEAITNLQVRLVKKEAYSKISLVNANKLILWSLVIIVELVTNVEILQLLANVRD